MTDTLSKIDSVMGALDAYPNLEDAILDKAQSEVNKYLGKLYPTQLDFSKEILEHLVGTDALINIVSKFLTVALPEVEIGLKASLLANMNNLGTNCTIDPFIYEKAIKEGVIFDLRQIDLYDKLTVSPLDKKIGEYFYFGIEGCESSYDVLQSAIDPNNQTDKRKKTLEENGDKPKEGTSYLNRAMSDSVGHYFGARKRDFDCLLWYMKNKAVTRQVWGKRTSESEDIFYGDGDIQNWINKKGDAKTVYYSIDGGSLRFYVTQDSKVSAPSYGQMIPMSEDIDEGYKFREGSKYYEYKFGNSPITKLSRKKTYARKLEGNETIYECYYFKGDAWEKTQAAKKYESTEKMLYDGSLKESQAVIVGEKVLRITSIKRNKNNENQIEKIKSDECIDITNEAKNDTVLFVDYDEDGKGEKIRRGENDIASTFGKFFTNNGSKKWYKKSITKEEAGDVDINDNCYFADNDGDGEYTPNIDKILIHPYNKESTFVNVNDAKAKDNRYTKDFGVLTLEYSPRTGNVIQSDGNPMKQQTPYDNVLHVFFGNVKELKSECREYEMDWATSATQNKEAQQVVKDIKRLAEIHKKAFSQAKRQWKKYKNGDDVKLLNAKYEFAAKAYSSFIGGNNGMLTLNFQNNLNYNYDGYDDINKLMLKVKNIKEIIDFYKDSLYNGGEIDDETYEGKNEQPEEIIFDWDNFDLLYENIMKELEIEKNRSYYSVTAFTKRISELMDKKENLFYFKCKNVKYPEVEKNYYLKKTLFEFNADYINSLQLFDPKVLAAQIITSLFGGVTMSAVIGATASWKTEYIHDVVKDMINKVIASEDIAVSDCFFTFTNDAYNGMLRAAELRQSGLYSAHGESNTDKNVNPIKLLESLNAINSCADQTGQAAVIEGTIENAFGEMYTNKYTSEEYLNLNLNTGIKISFVQLLLTELCTQVVMAMLSPKVYLLILINLEMFGLTTNYDLESFLKNFQNLIRSIVKSAVDQFMQYLNQEIMKLIEDLVMKLTKKLAFEQVENYARLIKQILMHIRLFFKSGQTYGWMQDNVAFADIKEKIQETVDEC